MSGDFTCEAWLDKPDGDRMPVQGNLSIGRTPSNSLALPDERVSRRHATIHAQGEHEFWFVDLGSRNGSYVNDRRVQQPVRLRDGDRLRLGPFALTFRQPAAGPRTTVGEPSTMQTIADIRPVTCWLLVADVVDSTQIARKLSGEDAAQLMGQWFLRCKEIVETAGGTMNKYLGDGFLAYWVASQTQPEHLVPVINSLRQLQQRENPQFRFVVHRGEALLGGVASLGEESLSGPAVIFVFRIEKVAGTMGWPCLVSQEAAQELESHLQLKPLGEQEVPGFDGRPVLYGI